MSSHSKRRAESEDVAYKKKARKAEDDEVNQDEEVNGVVDDDELDALDKGNIISPSRRTSGKQANYTEASDIASLENDIRSESERETQKVKQGASAELRTRSPQRKPVTEIEEEEEEEEEEEDYGNEEEYEDDGGGDEDNEDDIADEDEEEE